MVASKLDKYLDKRDNKLGLSCAKLRNVELKWEKLKSSQLRPSILNIEVLGRHFLHQYLVFVEKGLILGHFWSDFWEKSGLILVWNVGAEGLIQQLGALDFVVPSPDWTYGFLHLTGLVVPSLDWTWRFFTRLDFRVPSPDWSLAWLRTATR